jgi:hypothetical protein
LEYIKALLNEVIDVSESIAKIIEFIKDKNNILSERYELFVASLDILPKGKYVSDWSFTSRRSEIYELLDNPFEHCRGIAHASFIVECYLDETFYEFLPEDKEFVSLEDALSYMPNDKKEWCMKIVNALLDECLSGTGIDW